MTIKQQGGIFGRNPTFNDVDVENDLDVSGNADVSGTSTSKYIDVFSGVLSEEYQARIGYTDQFCWTLGRENATTGDFYIKSVSAGTPTEIARFASTGLKFPNGNGIDFSATSGTGTSELFDDYEEGTWTPVPSDATSGGNVGTGTISGLYTKVGNIVTAQFRIVNLNTTGMTAGNALRIQGLPFTSLSGSGNFVGSLDVQNVTFSDGISLQNSSGQSYLTLRELASSGAGSNLIVSDFASGSADVFGSITYTAA